MDKRSIHFYVIALFVLLAMSLVTFIKVFDQSHYLRYLFVAIFFVGLIVGYVRYLMKVKSENMKDQSKWYRYGFLLAFALIYMAIKYGVKAVVGYEASSEDYGTVIAFFFLGLFITYYGFYSRYLRKV
ncbi:hypothetical protein LOY85_02395 [Brevibacillus brevis]|uniref:hypothetical protein n=1 Tax=Brevibacillus brevis TaxID=1393 RepID=UPI001F2E9641|nr:hypothetical protein [Brevibacillus brevis]UIO43027.1 hypothetical protein LOY85_02395 [Brevibacillus brevis]